MSHPVSNPNPNRTVGMASDERIFKVGVGGGRWVWSGCRWAGGFATEDDARQARDLLASADPKKKLTDVRSGNAELLAKVEELAGKGW